MLASCEKIMGDATDGAEREAKAREPNGFVSMLRFWLFRATVISGVLFAATLASEAPSLLKPNFYVGTFTLPADLVARGMSSDMLASLFRDRIAEINRRAKLLVADKVPPTLALATSEEANLLTEIKLPVGDIDAAPAISRIRHAFGIEDAEITASLQTIPATGGTPLYELRAHASGREPWSEAKQGNDIGALLDVLALRFVERFDPLAAGFYNLATSAKDSSRLDRALSLAEGISPGDKREVWAHFLRGLAWREKGGYEKQIYIGFCSAIETDPKFTPAWRNLSGALRSNRRWSEAEDVALRLIAAFPNEPEGYRQIGYVYGRDCRLGDADERIAQVNFLRAIELDRRRNPGKDYLGLVDYARFLNDRASDEKRVPADPVYGIARDTTFLDAAERYLTIAQAHAPRETSIYTNFARVLGRPRSGNDKLDDARRYQADVKGRFALSIDRDQPMANFVVAELLTDAGMRKHFYHVGEKFAEAEKYLRALGEWGLRDAQYAAFLARALAGQGRYDEAETVLAPFANWSSGLVEWVHGEMLFNRAKQMDAADATPLLDAAAVHLAKARTNLPCGPRAAAIADLSETILKMLGRTDEGRSMTVAPRALASRVAVPVCAGWAKIDRRKYLAAIMEPAPAPAMLAWIGFP